jgi:hypothetical protein
MADLEKGTLVQHSTLGLGKVVALEANAVHVFFPDSDKRFAAKLRLPAARALLRTDGLEGDAWLEGLSTFSMDPKVGRYALAESWLTKEQALDQFLAVHPGGFADPAVVADGSRVACWRAAHARWVDVFGDGQLGRLAEGELGDVVKRLLAIEKIVAPLHPPADVGASREAFADAEAAGPFCAALVSLLSVPSPARARFDKLFAAARDLPVEPAQQWMLATLFPFIASPERHVLLRPKITCEAALRLGADLGETASPNWPTYAKLVKLSGRLLEDLKPSGAKDFFDVEAFVHVTATAKRRSKARAK